MGISRSRTVNLTLDDVRKGKHKEKFPIEHEVLSRTIFTASELAELKVGSDGWASLTPRNVLKVLLAGYFRKDG